jgi:Zn-dependent protease with chaperone function
VIFAVRLAVVTLSAFTAAGLVGLCLVPLLRRRASASTADARARALFALRMMPAAASVGTSFVVALSFLFFESRNALETPGRVLAALAVVGAVLIAGAIGRAALLGIRARRAYGAWLELAQPVDPGFQSRIHAIVVESAFPIVAVFGVFRRRLVIARSVLDQCPPEELAAVLAHEESHIRRGDNLRRALMGLAPDLLTASRTGRRIADDWHTATEEAADDAAARLGADGRATLAQALVRIARMAPEGNALQYLPTSALYRGENIEGRVRRLLAPPVPPPPRRRVTKLGTVLGLALVSLVVLGLVQQIIELAMIALP